MNQNQEHQIIAQMRQQGFTAGEIVIAVLRVGKGVREVAPFARALLETDAVGFLFEREQHKLTFTFEEAGPRFIERQFRAWEREYDTNENHIESTMDILMVEFTPDYKSVQTAAFFERVSPSVVYSPDVQMNWHGNQPGNGLPPEDNATNITPSLRYDEVREDDGVIKGANHWLKQVSGATPAEPSLARLATGGTEDKQEFRRKIHGWYEQASYNSRDLVRQNVVHEIGEARLARESK